MSETGARLTMSRRTPNVDKVLQVWDSQGTGVYFESNSLRALRK